MVLTSFCVLFNTVNVLSMVTDGCYSLWVTENEKEIAVSHVQPHAS